MYYFLPDLMCYILLHSYNIFTNFKVFPFKWYQEMHVLASGPELQAVRFGYVILGENWTIFLIDVPLTALNASADPTAIIGRNHVPMNQIYTVSTEPVVPRRRSTVRNSPATHPALT